MRVRFGEFVFDSVQRELRAGSLHVHLTPKAFGLLEVLLTARPNPVSKETLYERLWPQTFVGDSSLKMLVSVLRDAVGDDAHSPRWIKTVYGFGYGFASEEVAELADVNRDRRGTTLFAVAIGRKAYSLHSGTNILGRETDSDVVIDSISVSRHHAAITISADEAILEDLGSKNGTFVGSRRVTAPFPLKDGDKVLIGSVPLRFSTQKRTPSTITDSFSTRG